MTRSVFISYSKKDKAFAHRLADELESAGFKVWIDRSIGGGEDWRDSILKNLENAGEVIIVISPNAMASPWVNHEGSMALGMKKRLIPVLMEQVPALPPWLEEYQWIDFVNLPYERAFHNLANALTPPNPLQDLLNQEVWNFKQNGVLIDQDTLRVIKNARDTLTIDPEAEHLVAKSSEVVEARLQQERQVQAELERARRQREEFINRIAIVSFVLTILITAILRDFAPAPSAEAPSGLVSLELAGDLNTFNAIVAPWNEVDSFLAGVNLGFDFVFMIVYSTAFGLACFWAARKLRQKNQSRMAKLAVWAGYGMWLAAVFDAIENFALILTFRDNTWALGPQIASGAAIVKFGLLVLGINFLLVFWLTSTHWPARQPRNAGT